MKTKAENDAGYETADASVGVVVMSVGALLLAIAVCLAVATLFTRPMNRGRSVAASERSFQHGVVDDSTITRDWRAQDALVHEHLETYGWSDRQHQVARIPIARAMELMVEKESPQRGARP